MGWKVRSDKLTLVKKTGDTTQQVRFAIVKDRIKQELAADERAIEDGLDLADFQFLAQKSILIGNHRNLNIQEMEILKTSKKSLEEIRDYFTKKYKLDLKCFIDSYLNGICQISTPTLNRFMRGEEAIESESFQTICTVLRLDCHEIGMDMDKNKVAQNHKKLESLLWQLNHNQQITKVQKLAQQHHNLVCLKFKQAPETKIPMYWLIQTLIQPFDGKIEKFKIELNSGIGSNYNKAVYGIVEALKLPGKLKEKKQPDAIAKEIYKKIFHKEETTVLLFVTEERKNASDCNELVNQLYQSLEKLFVKQKPDQKLLMIWIDRQASSQSQSSDAFDLDDDDSIYTEILVNSKFSKSDIMEWKISKEVQLFINKTIKPSPKDSLFDQEISRISDENEEVKVESLLTSFYDLFNLDLESHQSVWPEKML